MQTEINEVEINGTKYVRKDSIKSTSNEVDTDGLQAVLIRSYAAGVHFGYIKSKEDTLSGRVVTLVNTRRVWCWYGAASLSQLALEGTKDPKQCKFSVTLPSNEITNVIEIIPLNSESFKNLNSVPVWMNK